MDTVEKYETTSREYINNQLQEDKMNDPISQKEYIVPFMGRREKEDK